MSVVITKWKNDSKLDEDDNEVVSLQMVTMKMSRDAGRQAGMAIGVWLNLWAPLYPLPQPGYQRSTAEKRQGKQEKAAVRRVKADGVKKREQTINI